MSSCRHCGSEVVWARNLDGSRWLRPLEPGYHFPELDTGSILVTLVGGEWREAEPKLMRFHRLHVCSPVEPPRDVAPPVEPDPEPFVPMTAAELRAAAQQINEAAERLNRQTADRRAVRARLEEMKRETNAGQADRIREAQAKRQRINCARSTPGRLLDIECPKCGAEVDEPCRSTNHGWLSTAHIERYRRADFTDDQPWPPRLGTPTQAGVVQMRRWLTANPGFFDIPDTNVPEEINP